MQEFISISTELGQKPDHVQAGGGNTSLKLDQSNMLIKASGYQLADMTSDKGMVTVNFQNILQGLGEYLDEKAYTNLLLKEANSTDLRPSMETGFHVLLDRVVLHTHSVYVNALTCSEEGRSALTQNLNLSEKFDFISYKNPGLDLTLEIRKNLETNPETRVYFLQNHGIIVSESLPEKAKKLYDQIHQQIHQIWQFPEFPNPKIKPLSDKLFLVENISVDIDEIKSKILFPDQVIYLNPAKMSQSKEGLLIYENKKKVGSITQILMAYLYLKKCFKENQLNSRYLSQADQDFLLNLDSEKYRQNLVQ